MTLDPPFDSHPSAGSPSIGDAAISRSELRVIWISPSYGYGGDLLYFKGLFAAFCRRFPNTGILVDPDTRYSDAEGIPLIPQLNGWIIKRNRQVGGASYDSSIHVPSPRFVARLLALRPAVAITIEFTLVSLVTIALASISKRFAVLLLVEGNPAARGGSRNLVVTALKRWACRQADAIQTSNEAGRLFLSEVLHAAPEKIKVAPYLTSCPPRPAVHVMPKQDDRLHILFANSLTARKGGGALLDALALLPDRVAKRISLTFVGDGPERSSLEARASTLRGPQITFAGAKPYSALGEYYAQAQVLAVPSYADYRSLAGFEGLAYGLALLASTADGASIETLDEGRCGIGINPTDSIRFAEAIQRFADQPAFLAQCQSNAARLFKERFSFEIITENLVESLAAAEAAHAAKKVKKHSRGE